MILAGDKMSEALGGMGKFFWNKQQFYYSIVQQSVASKQLDGSHGFQRHAGIENDGGEVSLHHPQQAHLG